MGSLLSIVRTLALCLLSVGLAFPAQDAASEHAPQDQIDQAIDRGAAYILSKQEFDGSWKPNEHRYVAGQTGLSLYTLLKAGVPRSHPSIQRGVAFLRAHPPRWTYGIACCILALHAADPELYRAEIEEWLELLLEGHGRGFSYPGGHEDLSLTQYGCLALKTAEAVGIEVRHKVWRNLMDYGLGRQDDNGAFNYTPGSPYTGSMTAAGIAVVHIAAEALRESKHLSPRDERMTEEAIQRGVEWLGSHMAMEHNPDPAEENKSAGHIQRWRLYYLYGLERVGGLTGLKHFGTRDWYREASDFLVKTQGDDGSWSTNHGEHAPGTCFGILVLKRATATASGAKKPLARTYGGDDPERPVSIRATGDTPLTIWVSQVGKEPLETHEWDDERGRGLRIWRVEYFDTETQQILATIQGDPRAPHGRERFAAQIRMKKPGVYKIAARMLARPIDDVDDEEVPLVSQTLTVRVDAVETPGIRRYRQDFGANVLAKTTTKVATSSAHGGHTGDRAVDGLSCYGWACSAEDASPWIELSPRRPQRATSVVLTPLWKDISSPGSWGHATRVRLLINGKNRGDHDVDLGGDGKAYLTLPKRATVRTVRIEVLSRSKGAAGSEGGIVGFGEVELQLE